MSQRNVVERWLALSHQVLVDEVHQLVRSHDDHAHRCWNVVREHPVLAARVRGILSALENQSAEYRDAAMWRIWIAQARSALTSSVPSSPPSQPSPSQPSPGDASTADVELDPAPDGDLDMDPAPYRDGAAGLAGVSSHHPGLPAQVIFREPGQ